MTKYFVYFDKRYLDGLLADLTLAGECVSFADYWSAQKHAFFLAKVEADDDFIRDVDGKRYQVSNVVLDEG